MKEFIKLVARFENAVKKGNSGERLIAKANLLLYMANADDPETDKLLLDLGRIEQKAVVSKPCKIRNVPVKFFLN